MVKWRVKRDIEGRINELEMNLSNNYKDLAHDALKVLQMTIEAYHDSGELKDKDYQKYKLLADSYAMRMKNYHH